VTDANGETDRPAERSPAAAAERSPAAAVGETALSRSVAHVGPGLAFAVALAVLAFAIGSILPVRIATAAIGMVLGLTVAAIPAPIDAMAAGSQFAARSVLRLGVVLLGASVSLQAVLALGMTSLVMIGTTMVVAFTVTALAARHLGVSRRLGTLIGLGNAVCGNSAIAAASPIVRAEPRETAGAIAVITAFGTLAVLLFPVIGVWAALPPVAFGLWCGIAINDTSQVVAAASAGGPIALQTATVIKFVRNTMLAPVLMAVTWSWREAGAHEPSRLLRLVRISIPPFVLGFVGLTLLNSLGVIPAAVAGAMAQASSVLIVVALVGVGLTTDIGGVRRLGLRPATAGIGTAILVAAATLLVVSLLGPIAGQ
jgi:uncharacterized integral membrane protein (TIGR00698 family)